jgi:copper chaperone NosL
VATVVGVALLSIAACQSKTDGPPRIVIDQTACSHCGMLVSEPLYAAAYQVAGSEPRVFDDIACMLARMRADAIDPTSSTGVRVWFHDANDGKWIDGGAVFVTSSSIRTPMGGGIIAFRDAAAAEQAAGRHKGQVVRSMPDLTKVKGEQ